MEVDILGNGFEKEILSLKDDSEGKVVATLIRKRDIEKKNSKAVLYIHGHADYFFQTEMAKEFNENGYDFYALDLRKYGRSLLPHQSHNYCSDITEYFEEIDIAIDKIRNRDNIKHLLLSGHSTGGLLAAVYANHNRKTDKFQAIFLNSPFFEFNENWVSKEVLLRLVSVVASVNPGLIIPEKHTDIYGKSLHKKYKGEWDYNLDWKPNQGFPVKVGWIAAMYNAQRKLQSGFDIKQPTLVMFSSKSSKFNKWNDELKQSDSVLNVEDIEKYSDMLGKNITKIKIKNGMHDLILSEKSVRENVYKNLFSWLTENMQ